MKSLVLSASLIGLSACGAAGVDGVDGKDGATGKKGDTGAAGVDGKDGAATLLDQIRQVYSNYRTSVYRITMQCDGVATIFGSGFRIDTTVIATNKHVVSGNCPNSEHRRFKIEAVYDYLDVLESGSLYGNGDCSANSSKSCAITSAIQPSWSYDLAKISIPNTLKGKPVKLSKKTQVEVGQSLLSMSFPLGFEDLYTLTGSVSSNYLGDCHGGSSYGCPALEYDFISSLDTDHGSSGSPIFDLITQEVVGVTTAGTDGENMNTTWAIDADKLNGF